MNSSRKVIMNIFESSDRFNCTANSIVADFLEAKLVVPRPPLLPLRFRIAKENAEPAGADLKNAAAATIGGWVPWFFIVHGFGKRLVNIVSGGA